MYIEKYIETIFEHYSNHKLVGAEGVINIEIREAQDIVFQYKGTSRE